MPGRAGYQHQFAQLRDARTIFQYRVILAFNGEQNFLSAASEKLKINGQCAMHFSHERAAAGKVFPRALDFKAHQVTKLRSVISPGNDGFSNSVVLEVFKREVDAPLTVVQAHVLPEIGQLKCRAGEIGELLTLRIAISANI